MTAYPAPVPAQTPHRERRPASLPQVLVDEGRPKYRRRVSAIVTTYNEADAIADCLESLTWCDEILVVDSNSTDATCEIARRYDHVRVLHREYFGAASQKNWAIDRCRHEWVLILDADERVTPKLRRELENILAAPGSQTAFAIRRRTYALGDEVRFSGWQHDRVVRFFRRGVHTRLHTRFYHKLHPLGQKLHGFLLEVVLGRNQGKNQGVLVKIVLAK